MPMTPLSKQQSTVDYEQRLNSALERQKQKLQNEYQQEKQLAIDEAVRKALAEERKQAAQNLNNALVNERVKLQTEHQETLNKIVEQRVEKVIQSEQEKRDLAIKAELTAEKMNLTEAFNKSVEQRLSIQRDALLGGFEQEKIKLLESFEAEKKALNEDIENYKKYAQKWENVEKGSKKELFLRRLNFAYIIVACLVIVQGVEAALFTQLAYKDAGYTGWWVQIVGGILCIGFQGIALFLTVNRKKVIQGVQIGVDEYGTPIYKKNDKGEIELEHFYNMTTMKLLCAIDFLINCFVLFGQSSVQADEYFKIARLICFSLITPLGIYFTSEVLLSILDKREKQLS